ncbi:MAG: mucoidy inhibitor MuiA family protein [Candidatus Cloacimonetes bacterium]|nr:mucoidy inhibitor MuiA family protein [Candidatus Cloacimonadota bacterium]
MLKKDGILLKIKTTLVLLTFIFSISLSFAKDIVLEDKITDVVVYPNQAMITRTAKVTLEKGLHKLIFDKIPSKYEEESIQVKGFGNAEIKDIKKVTDFKKAEVDERRKKLIDQIEEFDTDLRIHQDDLGLINEEKNVINNIMKKITSTSNKDEKTELDPLKWRKMVDFYKQDQAALNKKIRKKEQIIKKMNIEKQKIQDQLNQLGYNSRKSRKQIEVLIEATKSGRINLKLSYLVYKSSWQPKYDIRVSSDNKILQLTYKSEIRQNTGEDWKDVNLKISTAQPQIGGEHPELDPWRIKIYEYEYENIEELGIEDIDKIIALQAGVTVVDGEFHVRSGRSNEVTYSVDGMSVSDPVDGGKKTYKAPKIYNTASRFNSNLTSSVFEISGEKTILADNQEYSVTISINDFPANFRYSTVPKLSENAFLKAKVKNSSEFPFLAGSSNIFLDDNFVTSGYFEYAAPSEDFWTFLGVDSGIDIEYKFIKKFTEKKGVLSKKEKVRFEYEIIVKNNKKTEEDIVIWDQIPISSNKEIKIELIEPEYEKDSNKLKITKEKYLEWHYIIKPAEEITIPLKFSVEYQKNKFIEGL